MNVVLVRRKKLGRGSCKGIAEFMQEMCPDLNVTVYNHGVDNYLALCEKEPDVLIRWGCTATVPRDLPNGVRAVVVNHAKSIHTVSDKRGFRVPLNEHGLCPKTWFSFDNYYREILVQVDAFTVEKCDKQQGHFVFREVLTTPVIVRGANHSQGRDLHFCKDLDEVYLACQKYGEGNYYINEYIPKVAEYRVFVVNGRAVCVTNKTPKNKDAIAWNRHQDHGAYDNVKWDDWPLAVVDTACKAAALAGITFTGVDLIVDAQGKAYVVEANSAPTCSPYRQKSLAKVFNWMIQHKVFNEMLEVNPNTNHWEGYIHPAISDRAVV